MADILQEPRDLTTALIPLVRHLVTDAPHHDARVIPVMMYQIHEVFLHPFVENQIIAVRAFRLVPFVEALCHQHHTHLIASLYQLGSRHIMGSTDSVASHVLQDPDLTTDSGIIDGSP